MRNLYRPRLIAPAAFVALVSLTSCVTPSGNGDTAGDKVAFPGTILDQSVTDLLPAGSYTVELEDRLGGGTFAKGFVHLTSSGDPIDDCVYEVDVEQTRGGSDGTEEYTTSYTMVKPPGADSFTQVTRTRSTDEADRAAVGVWTSGDDPNGLSPFFVFPLFQLVERGGAGYYWCGIGLLDEVTRLADPDTGMLEWDRERFAGTAMVLREEWFRSVGELGGWGDGYWLDELDAYLQAPMYDAILENSPTRIALDADGVVTMVVGEDPDSPVAGEMSGRITVTFTPTDYRGVGRPDGAKTFLEKVKEAGGDPVKLAQLIDPSYQE